MTVQDTRRRIVQSLANQPLQPRIRRISLFGSHAKGAARAGSDVDLLVEFSAPVGFFDFVRLQRDLGRSLDRRVDLVTPASVSPYLRAEVLRSAIPIYGA